MLEYTPPVLKTEAFPLDQAPVQLQLNLVLDYHGLAQDILKLLRKDLSQRQLSENLGYTFNQVGKWESGATQIKLDDFLLIAKALEVPIEKHFRDSFWIQPHEFNVMNLVYALETTLNISTIQNKGFQKSLNKWLNGTAVPDFAEVLMMMGTKSPLLLGWLSRFLDCNSLSLLSGPYNDFLKSIDTVLTDPNVCFIIPALQLDAYKNLQAHDEVLLAEHAACSVDQLRAGLRLLVAQGLVSIQNNKYVPCSFDLSFPGLRSPKLRGFTKHALYLAATRYPSATTKMDREKAYNAAMGSVRVVALSAEGALKISDMISQFHNAIGDVVAQDQGIKDNVQVMLIQSFPSNINA
jgi:transcriptional regulator with XRE-family HTH domain